MSALLLDTHIWLWYAEGSAALLPAASIRKLDRVRRDKGLLISAISVWEVGMLSAKGRVQLSISLRAWVGRALDAPGMRLIPLDAAAAAESTLLPGKPQGDPADRLLIATARTQDVALATRDRAILDYGKAGFVRVIEL
ncbi:MAG TPA: type II toxin-antitoxin system VapC family toxin [Steroidobacteraceae bacterium]|jgi:PIN domain nuclease of toxin-antitoxin system|nr:type II toxin-antitoxin system VapC family toxin [Steroidobacteraceae bacterium]